MTALDHRGNADLFVTNVLNGTLRSSAQYKTPPGTMTLAWASVPE